MRMAPEMIHNRTTSRLNSLDIGPLHHRPISPYMGETGPKHMAWIVAVDVESRLVNSRHQGAAIGHNNGRSWDVFKRARKEIGHLPSEFDQPRAKCGHFRATAAKLGQVFEKSRNRSAELAKLCFPQLGHVD